MSEYNALVHQHFFNPQNTGIGDRFDAPMVDVSMGSIEMGSYARICFFVDDDKCIYNFRYQVYGNPYLIAGLSYWSLMLDGKTLSEAGKFSHHSLVEQLAIPKTKRYSALMIEDLLKKALSSLRENDG